MPNNIVAHESPVWKGRANFLIRAKINENQSAAPLKWEQLWTRELPSGLFEVCCIPFFVYNLSLGDQVTTGVEDENKYVVKEVTIPSGHHTVRVWFNEAKDSQVLAAELKALGCLSETRWEGSRLMAIDAESVDTARELANLLQQKEQLGLLVYETGRLK